MKECERMSKLCESFKDWIKNLLLRAKLWDLCSIQDVAWEKKNIIQKASEQSYSEWASLTNKENSDIQR